MADPEDAENVRKRNIGNPVVDAGRQRGNENPNEPERQAQVEWSRCWHSRR
ncbi:hypothetical protein PPUJ13061_55790 [Pseudomonas putida]|nr:hypothetical protein PPUJ13061_55790 [Pseudomonas putida]